MSSAELAGRFPSHRFVFYNLTAGNDRIVDLSDEQIDGLLGVCAERRLQPRSRRDIKEHDMIRT